MELRKLEYFEAVARLNSFTKAAEELHVSQPTISLAIKKLEGDLGLHLFVRDKRSVELTYEGEALFGKVSAVLQKLDRVALEMQELAENGELTLNIGIAPISGAFLYEILYKHPWHGGRNIRYKILELGSYGILEALERDELDLGYIVLEGPIKAQYNTIKSKAGEIKILLSREHPLAAHQRVPANLLDGLPIIHYPKHAYISRKIEELSKDFHLTFQILATPVQMITVYDLVQKNIGASFVLGDSYLELTKGENLVAIPLNPPLYYETGFVWKKSRPLPKSARMLIAYVNDN